LLEQQSKQFRIIVNIDLSLKDLGKKIVVSLSNLCFVFSKIDINPELIIKELNNK